MSNKSLYAHWCYCNNFGDALNPYLLKRLTGKKVKYCNTGKPNLKSEPRMMLSSIKHFRSYDFRRMTKPVLDKPVLLCVGSIMSRSHQNYVIWGAGFMDNKERSGGVNVVF